MEKPKQSKAPPSLRRKFLWLSFGTTVGFILLFVLFLLALIFNVLSNYTQKEVDFALEETAANVNTKTTLLGDILIEIRRSNDLMHALKGKGLEQGTEEDSHTETLFKHAVDIYSNKNTDKLNDPFLDMAYLFDKNGVSHASIYTEKLLHQQQQIDRQYMTLYQDFANTDADVAIRMDKEHINILYTLYDEAIMPCGTLIFAVNTAAVEQLVGKIEEYNDSFWIVHDKNGKTLLSSVDLPLKQNDIAQLLSTGENGCSVYETSKRNYRVCASGTNMGIGLIVGVSTNQLMQLLFGSIRYYIVALVLALVAVGLLVSLITLRLTKPFTEVANKMKLVADEQFDTKLPHYNSREFETISSTFNSMTDTIHHLINDVYETKLLVMDSEMKFVQSQMNPHFMYNVLNTISLQAKIDGNEEVYRMASNFTMLTQARLGGDGKSKVTLEQELQFAQFYLELQQSRFGDKLSYTIEVEDDALLAYHIPKLTIEMIAENAVLHGIEPKTEPGRVDIWVRRVENGICAVIQDNGVGFSGQSGNIPLPLKETDDQSKGEHNHIALNNAWRLIQHFYGKEYGIEIHSQPMRGTIVTVTIPFDKEGFDVPDYDC